MAPAVLVILLLVIVGIEVGVNVDSLMKLPMMSSGMFGRCGHIGALSLFVFMRYRQQGLLNGYINQR